MSFRQRILDFEPLYAATFPPPPPVLVRQDAEIPEDVSDLSDTTMDISDSDDESC